MAAMINSYKSPDYVDDLHDAIELALRCDLDEARFHAEVKRQLPVEFETATSRIARFGGI